MATANEVAQMEADLVELQTLCKSQDTTIAMLEAENDALRKEVARIRLAHDHELRRSVSMRTIMEQVSSGLIAGLQRMSRQEQVEQERRLGVNTDTETDRKPLFLQQQPSAPPEEKPLPRVACSVARNFASSIGRMADAAPKDMTDATGRVLADADPRLPPMDYPEHDPGDLHSMARKIV